MTERHLTAVEDPLASFLLSDLYKKLGLWSVQGQCGNLCKMLITLFLALLLSLSMSDCERLSHYCFSGAATGTKEGISCRFKKDVFSTACEVAVRIISLSSHLCCDRNFFSKCAIKRGIANQYSYLWQRQNVVSSVTLLQCPIPVLKSVCLCQFLCQLQH